MNPFASRINNSQSWVVPVSALSLVLGFMIVLVARSLATQDRFRGADADQSARLAALSPVSDAQQQQIREEAVEINRLRTENTDLQNTMAAEKSEATKMLNASLQEAKSYAGLTDLEGPGVIVTLSDANGDKSDNKDQTSLGQTDITPDEDKIIHDQDILRVVNELNAAGAEAISINNLRYVGTSSIRCVGPTVLVDAQRIASPIKIRAIGDPSAMMGGLKIPGGVIDQLKEVDPRMVDIAPVKDMTIPAYSGPTTRRFAKVPAPTK